MTAGSRFTSITLAGFMGTGKSTVGKIVAEKLGFELVDTDAVIVARAGRSIAEIFATGGESAFRALEATACADTVTGSQRVISVGGGALLNPAVEANMVANSLVICLMCDLDTIIQRVGDDPTRPLFNADKEKLAALYAQRADHYAGLPHHIDTTGMNPAEIAEEVIRLWQQQR